MMRRVFSSLEVVCRQFSSMNFKNETLLNSVRCRLVVGDSSESLRRCFHNTLVKNDLMEFFDDKKNWGEMEVKVGRSWRKDELRIKSNSDLHKLWFVLLKERNMLLTMEHECKERVELFPNPERIDKVNESMENVESVVRERNRAYMMLETGEHGERPVEYIHNVFGLTRKYKKLQHYIPERVNTYFRKKYLDRYIKDHEDVRKFLCKFRELKFAKNRKARSRDFNHVCGLLKRFPNMDMEALKQQYPDVNLTLARINKRSRGHRENLDG